MELMLRILENMILIVIIGLIKIISLKYHSKVLKVVMIKFRIGIVNNKKKENKYLD